MPTDMNPIRPAARAQRLDSRLDLSQLPVLRLTTGFKVAGGLLIVVGALWTLGVLGFLHGEGSLVQLLSPFTWVGMAILLVGLHMIIKRKEVWLDAERVALRARGLFGKKEWTEPLAAYRGVLLRSKWEGGGRDRRDHQIFLVELPHEQPGKTVVLFESVRDAGWHATWRDVSVGLHLTALEETPAGLVTHAPEDLSKSVRDKVRDGSLAIAFDATAPLPQGLLAQAADGGLDILVVQRNWRSPGLWGGVGLIVAALIFMPILMAWRVPGALILALGVLGVIAGLLQIACFLASRPRLQVGPERVVTSLMTPLGERRRQEMETARITGVQLGAPKGQQTGEALHISTDDGRVFFGVGLSRAALEWLRDCLLAAVARL